MNPIMEKCHVRIKKLNTNTEASLRNLSGSLLILILELGKFKIGEIRVEHDNRLTTELNL